MRTWRPRLAALRVCGKWVQRPERASSYHHGGGVVQWHPLSTRSFPLTETPIICWRESAERLASVRPGTLILNGRAPLMRLPRLLVWIASISMLGCQTSRSWEKGCPGPYSGVRYYRERMGQLPVDGKIFFTFDLPITIAADTALLPMSVFMKPKRPTGGFASGCKWAMHR